MRDERIHRVTEENIHARYHYAFPMPQEVRENPALAISDHFSIDGEIPTINIEDKELFIKYYEREIEYDFDELDEITLAYAISIHKSQGSEYPAVIIPLFMQHFMLLQRNLIYTALTRAKKLCIVIGQSKALAIAIGNNKGNKRTTFLTQFLTTDLRCR